MDNDIVQFAMMSSFQSNPISVEDAREWLQQIIPQIITIDLFKKALVNEYTFNIFCHNNAYTPNKAIEIAKQAKNLIENCSLQEASFTNIELNENIMNANCNIKKLII